MDEAEASWRRVHQAANTFEKNVNHPLSVTREEFVPKFAIVSRYDYGRAKRESIARAAASDPTSTDVGFNFSPIIAYRGQKEPNPSVRKLLDGSTGDGKKVRFLDDAQVIPPIEESKSQGMKRNCRRLVGEHPDTFGRVMLQDEMEDADIQETMYQTFFKPDHHLPRQEGPTPARHYQCFDPDFQPPEGTVHYAPERSKEVGFKYTEPLVFRSVPEELPDPTGCRKSLPTSSRLEDVGCSTPVYRDDTCGDGHDTTDETPPVYPVTCGAGHDDGTPLRENFYPVLFARDSKTRKALFPDFGEECPKRPISETREAFAKTHLLLPGFRATEVKFKTTLPYTHTERCTLNKGEFPFSTDGYVEPCSMRNIVTGTAHLGWENAKSVTATDYFRGSCHRARKNCCPEELEVPWSKNRKVLSLFVDLECPRRNGVQKFLDDDWMMKK